MVGGPESAGTPQEQGTLTMPLQHEVAGLEDWHFSVCAFCMTGEVDVDKESCATTAPVSVNAKCLPIVWSLDSVRGISSLHSSRGTWGEPTAALPVAYL